MIGPRHDGYAARLLRTCCTTMGGARAGWIE